MEKLTPKEQARLADLQKEGSPDAFYSSKLTMRDLQLVLRHDPGIRALIAGIVREPDALPAPSGPAAVSLPGTPQMDAACARVAHPVDSLAGPRRLRDLLACDEALCMAWLGFAVTGDACHLTRLIANAAHWDRIEALWDVLAQRCKQDRRCATAAEAAAIEECVRIHNLLWDGRQAALAHTDAGAAFDFGAHERGNATGQAVRETWLAGLRNAAGQLRRKTLVLTE